MSKINKNIAIYFNKVSKIYSNNFLAVNNVELKIYEGEFFGLLGPNGAGKTSLISILAGLSKATSGNVLVNNFDVKNDFMRTRRFLGIVPQEIVFDPFFNVLETLQIQSGYFGIKNNNKWIEDLLINLGLEDKKKSNLRQLSGGMKRRVLIAQALVHKPPIIVLDEPTAGVDVELRQTLWKFIVKLNKEGSTIILTTHYLEEAQELCNRIAMLKHGQIVALDETNKLLKSVSCNILQFKTNKNTDFLPEIVKNTAQIKDNLIKLKVNNDNQIKSYLNLLSDIDIFDIEILKTDLEDVFLDIMKD